MFAAWIVLILGITLLCYSLYRLVTISISARQQHINNNISQTQSQIMWHVYAALIACIMIATAGLLLVSI